MGLSYYHVSSAQFAPGDVLLPQGQTNVPRTEGGNIDNAHVFMSRHPEQAARAWGNHFAIETGRDQHVYEVKPSPARPATRRNEKGGDFPTEHLARSATVQRRIGTLSGDRSTWTYDDPEHRLTGWEPGLQPRKLVPRA